MMPLLLNLLKDKRMIGAKSDDLISIRSGI